MAQSVPQVPTVETAKKYTRTITATKMGSPSQRLVTTRSIFSEVVSACGALVTHWSIRRSIQA